MTVNTYDDGDNLIQATRNYLAGYPQNYQDKYNLITSYGYDKVGNQIAITDTVGQVNETGLGAGDRYFADLERTLRVGHQHGIVRP